LIKVEGVKQKGELTNLLNGLKNNPHEKAHEMYLTALAQFYAFVENNDFKALETVDDAIGSFPKNMYPYLTKLELLRKTNNLSDIEKTISEIESKFDEESDIFSKLPVLSCRYILQAKAGHKEQALKILNKEIKQHFSQTIYDNLLAELDKR
jgi:predicted negative regulator of RcsB-dependent stress response